jgi:cytochrome oxidase Cu insertion factor (SCO1/SenC/PrrC family)
MAKGLKRSFQRRDEYSSESHLKGDTMIKARIGMLLGLILALGLFVACGGDGDFDCDPSEVQNQELKIGSAAPDFRLPDHKGGYVRLSDFKGKSSVVIAFFPAAFTPV